jgi:hypothetical protein
VTRPARALCGTTLQCRAMQYSCSNVYAKIWTVQLTSRAALSVNGMDLAPGAVHWKSILRINQEGTHTSRPVESVVPRYLFCPETGILSKARSLQPFLTSEVKC